MYVVMDEVVAIATREVAFFGTVGAEGAFLNFTRISRVDAQPSVEIGF